MVIYVGFAVAFIVYFVCSVYQAINEFFGKRNILNVTFVWVGKKKRHVLKGIIFTTLHNLYSNFF